MKTTRRDADRRYGGGRLGWLVATVALGTGAAMLALGTGTVAGIGTAGAAASGPSAGDLDPTFGGDGKVSTNFGSGEEVRAVAIQADRKIVAAGCTRTAFALARYTPDGTLDSSFGGDGRVTTDLTRRGGDCALGVAVQADGKIVAAGHSGFGGPSGRFALVRYLPDGTLDSTFGVEGEVTTDFTDGSDAAADIAIQADGKIVAAGQSGVFGTNTMFAVARYNPDGTLDSTFGEDGRITTDFTAGDDGANAVAIQADGKIVVAGGAGTEGQSPDTGFALARYSPDGTLDPAFGEGGQFTNLTTAGRGAAISDIAILTSGRILAAGRDGKGGCKPCGSDMSTSFALVQYNADGTIDPTFGHDGLVITPLSPKDDIAFDLAIQTDGKIVAAGDSGSNGRNPKFAVVRYNPDGTLDPTFGSKGKVRTDFTPGADLVGGVVLQADGRIAVAGTSDYLGTRDRFALARYLSEPGSHRSPAVATSAAAQTGQAENGRIAFNEVFFRRESVAIFTANPDGTGIRQVTHPRRGVTTTQPDWSPDGRQIAYSKDLWGRVEPHIFVMRPDGAHRMDLTRGSCRPDVCDGDASPSWSPNGRRIAFHRFYPRDGGSIWVMRADGTHQRVVTNPSGRRYFEDWYPSWSPDGSRIVFERWWAAKNISAIFTVRVDGTHLRRVTRWRLDAGESPEWSPDGRWILFPNHTNEGGTRAQVCLIHPNGTGFRKITHGRDLSWAPGSFSPDGKMITVLRVPGETSENDVYVMDRDGSGLQAVTASLSNRRAEGAPDWGPRR